MIDVDPLIRQELLDLDPLPAALTSNWPDVLGRVHRPERRRHVGQAGGPFRLALAAALVGAAIASFATPLGAAIGRTLDGFSAWITGAPGVPASAEQQRAFEAANARSWTSFQPGTKLRKLLEVDAAGSHFTLLGFRSGDTLCLRLIATGEAVGKTSSCAPLQTLQTSKEPALVVATDEPFGGSAVPPGSTGYHPLLASVSFRIASDGVRDVILSGDDGRHYALVGSNAFLFVDELPKLGVRVRSAEAVAEDGSTAALPLAAAPFGGNGSIAPGKTGPAQGPTAIERHVSDGSIAWLDHRESRGEPLSKVVLERMARVTFRTVDFARAVQPDPSSPARIAFMLGKPRHSYLPNDEQLCVFLLNGDGGGGGCSPVKQMFQRGPLSLGVSQKSGADQYAYFAGAVSDDVASLKIFLANGTVITPPVVDNAYAVPVPRGLFPARVVAYDAEGRIIGNELAPS